MSTLLGQTFPHIYKGRRPVTSVEDALSERDRRIQELENKVRELENEVFELTVLVPKEEKKQ